MRIAVLGAFGLMGEAALHDLANNPRVSEVLAADVNLARAKQVLAKIKNRRKITAVQADLTDTAAAARKLKGARSILNASWYEYNLKAMDLALAVKAHYCDLGGLYHMTLKQLKRSAEFKKAELLGALGVGSTPGITNMMVAKMAPSFETIETVGIYDASHDPTLTEESFLPPFSIRTMLDEYEQPAPVWLGGRMKDVPAHSGAETLDFAAPIGRVSAGTVIHSETATLPGYLKSQKVKNLFFKIVYPESVKRQLALLVGMGLSKERALLTRMAQKSALDMSAAAPRDFEVLRVKITGTRRGQALEKTWDCTMRPTRLLSAGAMGVGFTGAITAVMMARQQTLARSGVDAPERVLQPDPFFKELVARKVFGFAETISHPLPM